LLVAVLASALVLFAKSKEAGVKIDGLSIKQQSIVSIAAFTANGNVAKLKTALGDGLDAGWTINEIKEVLVQLYAYAGFPRSLNAINAFLEVLDERQRRGVADPIGAEPSPFPPGKSSVELGRENMTRLAGHPPTGRHIAFCPAIETFLEGHLFGDILGRDNLDVQSRELATIAALATLEAVNPQLTSHLNVGLSVGLTEPQLRDVVAVIRSKVGEDRGDNAAGVLDQVIRKRHATPPSVSSLAPGESAALASQATVRVLPRDAQTSESAPVDHFTGSARVQRLFQASDPARASGGSVTFEPGARTAWHAHPLGQTLIVTAGTGWVQQWGQPARRITEGDVVSIPPGAKHWHGAAVSKAMTHIAIQEQLAGKTVEWMEAVSDEQYGTAQGP
jgi:quercetin dioxygenase-like cupin family protein/alkylhydroperoxidase/carboxymuconolactone decarboxylase family protein YurZ